MKTVAVIQARMGSTRLPGKTLELIGRYTVLEWVIYRTLRVENVDEVVVATSWLPEDDPIEQLCVGVPVVRGHPTDLLDRYMAATVDADQVLRVTADCPLLDPGLNTRILKVLRYSDYVSYRTSSNGLIQEAFTRKALERAAKVAVTLDDREHVVPFMLRNLHCYLMRPPRWLRGRWCVDTHDDLDRLRDLYERAPNLFDLSAQELVGLDVAVSAG